MGDMELADSTKPVAYITAPKMMALRSLRRSAKAPNMGCPMPHARFCIAIAKENSARAQPNSAAIGI